MHTSDNLDLTILDNGDVADLSTVSDDFEAIDDFAGDVSASIADVEQTVATSNHAVGDYFMLGGVLMRTIAAIATGEQITTSNAVPATLQGQIDALRDSVDERAILRYDSSAKATVIEVLNNAAIRTRLVLWEETKAIQYQKLINSSWTTVFTK